MNKLYFEYKSPNKAVNSYIMIPKNILMKQKIIDLNLMKH